MAEEVRERNSACVKEWTKFQVWGLQMCVWTGL